MNQDDPKDKVSVTGQGKMLSFLRFSVPGVSCSLSRRKNHAKLSDREVLDSNSNKGQQRVLANKFS